jgi:molybdenum cofactor biosynthesis enzyme MoaA
LKTVLVACTLWTFRRHYPPYSRAGFGLAIVAGAAIAAGFPQIKINCVLMRGRNHEGLAALVDFAAERNLLLRFIELMPVSTTEVLTETNFFPVAEARRAIEGKFGALLPQPEFRTNGPASYYQIPGRAQRIGFITERFKGTGLRVQVAIPKSPRG